MHLRAARRTGLVLTTVLGAAVLSAVTLVFIWHPQSRHFVREAARRERVVTTDA